MHGSTNMGYVHKEIVSPSFIIIQQIKGYNLQHTQCNFIFLFSQYPLLEYNILYDTQPQYNSLIQKWISFLGENDKATSNIRSVNL
jgi:hypothetical protein